METVLDDNQDAVEGEAKRMGWVPEDDFKGDKDRWVTAEKFVERGKNELPIMRERMKKYDGTIVTLNKEIQAMRKTFGEFQEHQTKVAENAYNRAVKDLTEKQRAAVEEGDVASFDAAEKAKEGLAIDVPKAPDPAKEEFDVWIADGNQWYNDNKKLQSYASRVSAFVQESTGLKDGKDLYNAVKKEVERRFPEEFENGNRNEPPRVDGGGEKPPKGKKKSYANLPADAKAACDKFVKQIPGYTKEQYVKEYGWEE